MRNRMEKANFWKTLGLGVAITAAACAPQKQLSTTSKDVGTLPALEDVMEWIKPDSVDCDKCIVDATNFGKPLVIAYTSRETSEYPEKLDSIVGNNDKVLALDFTLNIDSLLNLPRSTLNKLVNDDMYKSALPKVVDKTQVYDTIPVFDFNKDMTKEQAKRVMSSVLKSGAFYALSPTEVLSYNVDEKGKHATLRVTAYMPPETMSLVDTTGVYADFEKDPVFDTNSTIEDAVVVEDEVEVLKKYVAPAKKESKNNNKNNKLRAGLATSYNLDNMIGVGPRVSVGPLSLEGQYFVNPTESLYDINTREEVGVGTLSASEKIQTTEYLTTTGSESNKPVFRFSGLVDIPLNNQKNFFATVGLGPCFYDVNENTTTEQRKYFTSTESGDALGSQPTELPISNESSTLKYGGLIYDVGLKGEFANGDRLGLRVGLHDMPAFLNNAKQGNVTVTYDF